MRTWPKRGLLGALLPAALLGTLLFVACSGGEPKITTYTDPTNTTGPSPSATVKSFRVEDIVQAFKRNNVEIANRGPVQTGPSGARDGTQFTIKENCKVEIYQFATNGSDKQQAFKNSIMGDRGAVDALNIVIVADNACLQDAKDAAQEAINPRPTPTPSPTVTGTPPTETPTGGPGTPTAMAGPPAATGAPAPSGTAAAATPATSSPPPPSASTAAP